jgi:hypothetical protein
MFERRVRRKMNVGPSHNPTIVFTHNHTGARRRREGSRSARRKPEMASFDPWLRLPAAPTIINKSRVRGLTFVFGIDPVGSLLLLVLNRCRGTLTIEWQNLELPSDGN